MSIWRKLLRQFLVLAAYLAVLTLCEYALHRVFHYGVLDLSAFQFYEDIKIAALVSMFLVGSKELELSGHVRTKRILSGCAIGALAAPFIFIFTAIICKFSWPVHLELIFCPLEIFSVAPFGMALYFNSNQMNSTLQHANEVRSQAKMSDKEEVFSKLLFLINLSAQRQATELIATDNDRTAVLDQDVENDGI
jgi:hypothetical protein